MIWKSRLAALMTASVAAGNIIAVSAAYPIDFVVELASGFTPNPQVVAEVHVLGEMNAVEFCSFGGWLPEEPSAVLIFAAGDTNLKPLAFDASTTWGESADLVMAVTAPDGTISCDDDAGGSFGHDPRVTVFPSSGEYEIRVGIFQQSDAGVEAIVTVTELEQETAAGAATTLTTGFMPNPQVVAEVQALAETNAAEFCSFGGWLPEEPSAVLFFTAGDTNPKPLAFAASTTSDQSADLVMAVTTPDGTMLCNDDAGDSFGTDPVVTLLAPSKGEYEIRVGVYRQTDTGVEAFVVVAEPEEETVAIATATLATGFMPNPQVVAEVQALAEVDAKEFCNFSGYLPDEPSAVLAFTAGNANLKPLFVVATATSDESADLVMAVTTPDGTMLCNDDAGDSFGTDPVVTLLAPSNGEYEIRIGVYRQTDTGVEALVLAA